MAYGKKTGGREKGVPNRLTKELRTQLKNIIAGELELLPDHIASLPPKDRLEIICKLMPFVLPKVASVHMREGEPFDFDDIF